MVISQKLWEVCGGGYRILLHVDIQVQVVLKMRIPHHTKFAKGLWHIVTVLKIPFM